MGNERSVLLSNRHFKDINPLVCGEQNCPPGYSFGPASRSYYLLHYVVSGKGTLSTGGREYPVSPFQCFVIRPFEINTYWADEKEPWHYLWIGFASSVELPSIIEQQAVFDAGDCAAIFRSMLEAKALDSGREGYLCGKIWELLSTLWNREDTAALTPSGYVRLAKNCFESEYMQGVTVAEVARRLGLDRSYFSTLFKKQTGVSPKQYLNEFRLSRAMDLIQNHGYTPSMAALSTGYQDVFTFSRMFKRRFGSPPSSFSKGAEHF